MKNSIFIHKNHLSSFTSLGSLLCILALFLTSCEENSMLDMQDVLSETSEMALTKNTEFLPINGEVITITESQESQISSNEVNSRNPRVLIYSKRDTLNSDTWINHSFRPDFFADPFVHKLEVEVTPINGDPDLFFVGEDLHNPSNRYREIRKSVTTGVDKGSARVTDLMSYEEYLVVSIYAYGYTRAIYDIKVYQSPVDCQEYPAAADFEEGISYDYIPVCGCDGVEYRHRNLAVAAGITSWSEGKCCVGDYCEEIEFEQLFIEGEQDESPHAIWNGLTENTLLTTPNWREAKIIQHIFKEYSVTNFCRVGEIDAKFTYILSQGDAPEGAIAAEDCVRFNPNTLRIANVNGNWEIVEEDNNTLYNFGSDRKSAERALCIIQKHGFRQQCFVGRPQASLIYMRR